MTIVATAGHVDHGKTTLVRALTGVDTDRLPQEKARGLSIDLGFAYLPVPGRPEPLAFIDVPGHERFIRNMISGVHMLDIALLVVAADDGPMPQTREHLAILLALGTPRALVALTKVDRVDEARRAHALHEIEELLSGTRFSGAPVFPVVGPSGEGLPPLRAALEAMSADPRPRDDAARFRLHVDRAFVLQGIGLVVTGAVVAGSLEVGDEVWVSRLQRSARVRSLRANDSEATCAHVGQRCALALSGFARDEVQRGDVLTGLGPIPTTRRIDLFLHDGVDGADDPLPRSGRSVMVCLGAQAVRATLSPVGTDTAAPRLARLALETPLSAFLGDVLLLRDVGRNTLLAGGTVLDPRPPQTGPARRRQALRLRALAGVVPPTGRIALPEVVAALLGVPRDVLEVDWLHAASGLLPARIDRALGESGGVLFECDGAALAVSSENATAAALAVEATLDAWHGEHPQQLGPRWSEILPLLRDWPVPLIREALADLVSRAALVRSGPYVRRPGHRPTLSGGDNRLWQSIAPTLDDGQDPKPPRVHELAERFGMPAADIEAFLIRASHAGLVYRVARNRFFLPRSMVALARLARQLADESGTASFDAASFRTRSGLGRNLTIEVLEFLDGAGLTRRRDAVREVIGAPEDLRLSTD